MISAAFRKNSTGLLIPRPGIRLWRLAWPGAATPALELSMPFAEPEELFQLGRALRPLRDDGVLIVGTGGLVHNLRRAHLDDKDRAADDWAAEFDRWVAAQIADRKLD